MNQSYYMELGGGLGDAFQQLYQGGELTALERDDVLVEGEELTIAIISHNPCIAELFANHPKRSRMTILQLPYWMPEDDARRRRQFGLPPCDRGVYTAFQGPRCGPGEVPFYTTLVDDYVIDGLQCMHGPRQRKPIVVFAVSAGLSERTFPQPVACRIAEEVLKAGYLPVVVGRDYQRFDRKEWQPESMGIPNLVNQLSVPGVAKLVQQAAGVVCCHSAVNMLASYERKPQFLLYDQGTKERHFTQPDQWGFMADFPEVIHGTFDEVNEVELFGRRGKGAQMLDRFFGRLNELHS